MIQCCVRIFSFTSFPFWPYQSHILHRMQCSPNRQTLLCMRHTPWLLRYLRLKRNYFRLTWYENFKQTLRCTSCNYSLKIKLLTVMKIVILLLVISAPLFAQNVDYNKIILPESSQSSEFEEKLVQIAWRNHPDNEALRREVNIAGYNVKQNNSAWLENIRVTGNMNEFTINKQADPFGRAAFYPKYNISASVSLGTFFSIPYNIKKSREALIITQA